MPGPNRPQMPEQQIACAVCRKEIPLSSAFTPQGAEYIEYFCGMECYEEFVAAQKSGESGKTQK
jgi:YHS domain-containing protein